MRVFNFSAGPAVLPLPVLEQARDEMLDWQGGMSVMEISHRSKAFMAVAEQAEADLRELLAIPSGYKVLFMQGGATGQFSAVPLNLSQPGAHADYIHTGHWSERAIKEARRFLTVDIAADEAASSYTTVPEQSALKLTAAQPTFITRRTRRSAAWSFPTFPRPAMCRSSPTCPRRSCHARSMCRDSG